MSHMYSSSDKVCIDQRASVESIREDNFSFPNDYKSANVSSGPTISLQQLAKMPKPVPFWDFGVREPGSHMCLENKFYSSYDLIPFVIVQDGKYCSIFPGCRHMQLFDNPLDVIIHIYQEHLARFTKDYYCVTCLREFGKIGEAKRHVKTENAGKVYQCRVHSCDRTAKRADAVRVHERTVHGFFSEKPFEPMSSDM